MCNQTGAALKQELHARKAARRTVHSDGVLANALNAEALLFVVPVDHRVFFAVFNSNQRTADSIPREGKGRTIVVLHSHILS